MHVVRTKKTCCTDRRENILIIAKLMVLFLKIMYFFYKRCFSKHIRIFFCILIHTSWWIIFILSGTILLEIEFQQSQIIWVLTIFKIRKNEGQPVHSPESCHLRDFEAYK